MTTKASSYKPNKQELILTRIKESSFFKEFVNRLPDEFNPDDISYSLKYHARPINPELKHEKGIGLTREIVRPQDSPKPSKPQHIIRDKGEVYRDE